MFFSVIVTAYGVESYLKTCIDSILKQTFEDFELILVDDESPDHCPEICDEYAARDKRVRVIHQKNAGPAGARKSGILASKGQYILFVDGDDWVSPDFLKKGYDIIEENGVDIILFSVSLEYGHRSESRHEPIPEGVYDRTLIKEMIYPLLLMGPDMRHMFYYISGKIIRRRLVMKHYVAVPAEISLGEDMLCMIPACLEAEEIYVSNETMSFYRIRERSGSHGFQTGHYRQVESVLERLGKMETSALDLPPDFHGQMERYGAYMYFTLMVHAANDGQKGRLLEVRRKMRYPLLEECVRRAQFGALTPKTAITLFLIKRKMIRSAYFFLRICRRLKAIVGREKKV